MEKPDVYDKIDRYQAAIAQHRPLTANEAKMLDEYFRVGTTYTSNAIEGNSLTLTETKVLLESGITIGGKPIRDCYEATGHAKAYDYMLQIARADKLIASQRIVLQLHELFYSGIDAQQAGSYRTEQVFISGTDYLPPPPEDVPEQMARFMEQLLEKSTQLHPVALAAFAHRRLVDIHPFIDGNGRTARLLMNLILVNRGYCIVSIPPIMRMDYILALQVAQRAENPNTQAFDSLIAECEMEAQRDYCRMLRIKLAKDTPEH